MSPEPLCVGGSGQETIEGRTSSKYHVKKLHSIGKCAKVYDDLQR